MKKKITIFGIISLFLLISISVVRWINTSDNNSSKSEADIYYDSYKDPFVINLRKRLNSYLINDYSLISDLALNSSTDEQYIYGLDSFDKSYYESKFIVMTINEYLGGGKLISIIFQDRPDRQFNSWMYKLTEGDYELRTFSSSSMIKPSDFVKTFPEEWKPFLLDKDRAL